MKMLSDAITIVDRGGEKSISATILLGGKNHVTLIERQIEEGWEIVALLTFGDNQEKVSKTFSSDRIGEFFVEIMSDLNS
jgi:hypothetical protein